MYTLLLPASVIPDQTVVRKATGEVKYTLRRSPVRVGDTTVTPKNGTVFLANQRGPDCYAYPETTKFAIDFVSVSDLQDFIFQHLESHQ